MGHTIFFFLAPENERKKTKQGSNMASSVVASSAATDVDSLAKQAILHRESVAKNYIAIINPLNKLPMLQLRKEGDCEIADPRACLNHYNGTADLCCLIYVHVSYQYFSALIKIGLITDKERAVLRCTEHSAYAHVTVTSKSIENLLRHERVEDLLERFRDRPGVCRSNVEILKLDVGFEFVQVKGQLNRKRKPGLDATGIPTTHHILSEAQWRKHVLQCKGMFDCQRKLHTDEMTKQLSACRREPTADGSIMIPIFVIEGPWGLVPDPRLLN